MSRSLWGGYEVLRVLCCALFYRVRVWCSSRVVCEMKRSKPLRAHRNGIGVPGRAVSAASPTQRMKVVDRLCLVCAASPVDPAHLIPRGVTSVDQDDPLAVVPLCRGCHRLYDDGELDLSPYLEPGFRAELAFAVRRVGLFATLRRVTNQRWREDS